MQLIIQAEIGICFNHYCMRKSSLNLEKNVCFRFYALHGLITGLHSIKYCLKYFLSPKQAHGDIWKREFSLARVRQINKVPFSTFGRTWNCFVSIEDHNFSTRKSLVYFIREPLCCSGLHTYITLANIAICVDFVVFDRSNWPVVSQSFG